MFTTIGKVERAEIQYEPNGRSRGTGVVEFDNVENADTAIGNVLLTSSNRYSIPSYHANKSNVSQLNLPVTNMVEDL